MLEPIDTSEKKTESGVIYQIQNPSDEPTRKGKVLRVGTRVNDNMKRTEQVKEGDVINYFPATAQSFTWDNKPFIMVHIDSVSTID